MGASVVVYWPGITEEQLDSQPAFDNDDKAWGNWMAEREDDGAVLTSIRRLGAEAILTVKTDGWEDEDVTWVTPQQLRYAALTLKSAVLAGSPEAEVILGSYERNANRIGPVANEFVRDLENIASMAEWAERERAHKITLEVNW
jgi:hypothetical protein